MNLGGKIGLSILVILLGVAVSYLSIYGMTQLVYLIDKIKIPERFGGFMEFVCKIGVLILLLVVFAGGIFLSVTFLSLTFIIVFDKIFEIIDFEVISIVFAFLFAIAITFIPDIFTYFKDSNSLSAFKTSYFYDYYSHIKGIKKITTAGLFSGIWLIIKLIFNTILYYGLHVGSIFAFAYLYDDLF